MKQVQACTVLVVLASCFGILANPPGVTAQVPPTFGESTDPNQPGIRWLFPDNNAYWVPIDVAIGDRGAAAFCGVALNSEQHLLFAGGSPRPVFVLPPDTTDPVIRMYADMAEHGPLAAALTTVQTAPPPTGLIVPTLTAYDHAGNGAPLWSFEMAGSIYWSEEGSGVRVSRHGEVVLAWWGTTELKGLQVEAFHGDGQPLSSTVLFPTETIPAMGGVDLSDDGSRALLAEIISKKVVILDVASGTTEFMYEVGLSAVPVEHALSGDGLRFVSSENSFFDGNSIYVWQEGSSGSWNQIRHLQYPFEMRVWEVAIDRTGSRVAFILQNESVEGFRVLLYDVESDTILFDHPFDAPGTTLQNVASDLCIDDEGRTVAGSAWGDSFNLTPEIFVLDESGELLRAIDTGGSGRTVDITPEGDLVIAGSKRSHSNQFGPGGDLLLIETRPLALHVAGLPSLGNKVVVQVDGGEQGDLAIIAAAEQLLGEPDGNILLDFSSPAIVWPPFALDDDGSLELAFHVPQAPALVGFELHVQAVVGGSTGAVQATNQVSLRLLAALDS
jgi:hypothetical protein